MRNLLHIVHSLEDLFNSMSGHQPEVPEPRRGMKWNVVHERTYPDPYRGLHDPHAHFQIIGADDESVELVENGSWYTKLPREEWAEFYEDNFRRARSAKHTPGKGSMVPYYQGIQPIDDRVVERHRNPFVLKLGY